MRSIVQFDISLEDGIYTASGANVAIVTDGSTFEELQENIRDAVSLYFEGNDPASLGFNDAPSILTYFEVPTLSIQRAVGIF